MDKHALRQFRDDHMAEIEECKRTLDPVSSRSDLPSVVTPTQLDDLWITNKFERLLRLQTIADGLYQAMVNQQLFTDAVLVREYRSYLQLVANELGQLLHRGSGDSGTGDTMTVDIQGVNMDSLR
jgi:regulatory protein YycH of two-component signal transduction system YycFG